MTVFNFNFNLLKALYALLLEQNVSKAGAKIGITQSAMSISLRQLRIIYKDELLVRSKQGSMALTPFAKTLIEPVKLAIKQTEEAFKCHVKFDPVVDNRTYHIGMSDYVALVLLPKLMQEITRIAPNVKIIQRAMNDLDDLKPFEELSVDMAIGRFPRAPKSLKVVSLFKDQGIIVADKNHPLFKMKHIKLDEYEKYSQIFISFREKQPDQSTLVQAIEKQGCKLHIQLMTPHTLIALQALPGTHLIANVVERLANPFIDQLGLKVKETPYYFEKFHAKLFWHSRDQNDSGHIWLRTLIKKIANQL